jgi:hypothetical protein
MSPDRKKIYIALVIFGILFGLAFKLLGGAFYSLKNASQSLVFQKKAEFLFNQRIKEYEIFKKEKELYSASLAKLGRSFIARDAPVKFIEFLEDLALNSNVISDITPYEIKSAKNDFWSSLGFRVLLKGSFPNSLKFLEGLEKSPWLVDISSLQVERIDEAKTNLKEFEMLKVGDVTFLLTFKAFSNGQPNR